MQDEANSNPDELLPTDHEPDEAELDLFLNEQDPEFAARMKELSADKSLKAEEIHDEDIAEELKAEIALWENGKPIKKFLYRNLRFLPRLSLRLKKWRAKAAVKIVAWAIAGRNVAHDLGLSLWKSTLKGSKAAAIELKDGLKGGIKSFTGLSLK